MEIACIVEGDGEIQALPILIRRILADMGSRIFPTISVPVVWPRSRLVKREFLMRAVGLAAQRATRTGAILVLLDADDDCPVSLGAELRTWASAARSDIPIGIVIANREYEAWFLAAAESLRGHRGLRDDVVAPDNCDSIRDAKGWLEVRSATGEQYDPIDHQASFSATIDLELARQNSRSFRKLDKEVRRLIQALQAVQG